MPPKPRDIIIERWLPYQAAQRRKVIYQRAHDSGVMYTPKKNMIIQYQYPKTHVERVFQREEAVEADPRLYVSKFGYSLMDSVSLEHSARQIGVVEDISVPIGESVCSSEPNYLYESNNHATNPSTDHFMSELYAANINTGRVSSPLTSEILVNDQDINSVGESKEWSSNATLGAGYDSGIYMPDRDYRNSSYLENDLVPCSKDGMPLCSFGNDSWMVMAEKAVAAVRGSYFRLHSGRVDQGLQMLTGKPVFQISVQDCWSDLKQALSRGHIVCCSVRLGWVSIALNAVTSSRFENCHAFSILSLTETSKGNKMIKVFNPWGDSLSSSLMSRFVYGGERYCGPTTWIPFHQFVQYLISISECYTSYTHQVSETIFPFKVLKFKGVEEVNSFKLEPGFKATVCVEVFIDVHEDYLSNCLLILQSGTNIQIHTSRDFYMCRKIEPIDQTLTITPVCLNNLARIIVSVHSYENVSFGLNERLNSKTVRDTLLTETLNKGQCLECGFGFKFYQLRFDETAICLVGYAATETVHCLTEVLIKEPLKYAGSSRQKFVTNDIVKQSNVMILNLVLGVKSAIDVKCTAWKLMCDGESTLASSDFYNIHTSVLFDDLDISGVSG
ncbi:hypothetical protein ACOME3_003085 [Neoechinorhynchus agilis]